MNLRNEEKEKIEHVLFVLDKSGSMEPIRKETLSGLNEQIQELKKTGREIKTFVSLVVFDSEVEFVRWEQPLEEFAELSEDEYKPGGMTAMLDGVGQGISRLKNSIGESQDDVSFLVIIVSDGHENASKEYGWQEVANIITEAKNKKWTITYMGANQDLSVVQKGLNIDAGNITIWSNTLAGTQTAYSNMSGSLAMYRCAREVTAAAAMDTCNFYSNVNSTEPDSDTSNNSDTN